MFAYQNKYIFSEEHIFTKYFLFEYFSQNGKMKYAKLIPVINSLTNEMEGKGQFDWDSDEEHDIGVSPLFNTVLNNKLIRLFSENIYESFSQS